MDEIKNAAMKVMEEILAQAELLPGELVVVGCSSSEILGERIGTGGSPEAASAVLAGILPVIKTHGLYLAAQCCEHLNRALVLERAAAERFFYENVCVRPVTNAGGSFAAAAYEALDEPVVVEHIKASAGMDIGGTLIGMHLKDVAVPIRLTVKTVGEAIVLAARTRPRLIGGARAQYPEK